MKTVFPIRKGQIELLSDFVAPPKANIVSCSSLLMLSGCGGQRTDETIRKSFMVFVAAQRSSVGQRDWKFITHWWVPYVEQVKRPCTVERERNSVLHILWKLVCQHHRSNATSRINYWEETKFATSSAESDCNAVRRKSAISSDEAPSSLVDVSKNVSQ